MRNLAIMCIITVSFSLTFNIKEKEQSQIHGEISSITQTDFDLDGKPDLTTILCSCITGNDQIMIYDGGNDMHTGDDINEMVDFKNDVWLFDTDADNKVELIIQFGIEGDKSYSNIFDDQDNDGIVKYEVDNKSIVVTESKFWTVRVEADGYWSNPEGEINLNLTFYIDGWIQSYNFPQYFQDYIKNDGAPDYKIHGSDANLDGVMDQYYKIPLFEYSSLYSDLRNFLIVNVGEIKALPPDGYIFWPFLGGQKWYDEEVILSSIPIITIDWELAKVYDVGMHGKFPYEIGYHLNTMMPPWRMNEENNSSFESPMAYYDLANDMDSLPELFIRHEYFGAFDPYLDVGLSDTPLNDIRYSWNQDNSSDLVWDYKLGLAGRHTVDSIVDFNDFAIQLIPYDDFPYWITRNQWDWGTFIANEGGGYPSSEGIYEWSALNVVQPDSSKVDTIIKGSQQELRRYLFGVTDNDPGRFYNEIRTRMRAEYGNMQSQPYLYFSLLDERLHLKGAEKGVWNLGNGSEIRYLDQNEDNYFDELRYITDQSVFKRLILAQTLLISADASDSLVSLKNTDQPPSLFEIFPPRNHEEWLTLGEKLTENQNGWSPENFDAFFARVEAPQTKLVGAILSDYRAIQHGFRFVLYLQPDFILEGEDWIGLRDRAPGAYVVTFDGAYHVAPAVPPDLVFTAPLDFPNPAAFAAQEVGIRLANHGTLDAARVLLKVGYNQPGGPLEWLELPETSLLAGEEINLPFTWAAPMPGVWEFIVTAQVLDAQGSPAPAVAISQQVDIAEAAQTTRAQEIGAFGLVHGETVFALLGLLLLAAVITVWVLLRASPVR